LKEQKIGLCIYLGIKSSVFTSSQIVTKCTEEKQLGLQIPCSNFYLTYSIMLKIGRKLRFEILFRQNVLLNII